MSVGTASRSKTVPLREDAGGVIRINGTRVTLDTVVAAFCEGATAEEIAQQYPTLDLADIYAVLGHYLRHKQEVEDYLCRRQKAAAKVRQENQKRFDPKGVRDRLLARRNR